MKSELEAAKTHTDNTQLLKEKEELSQQLLHEKKKAAENKKWAKEIEKQAMVKQQELQRKIDDQA